MEPAKLRELNEKDYLGQTVVLKRWTSTTSSWFRPGGASYVEDGGRAAGQRQEQEQEQEQEGEGAFVFAVGLCVLWAGK